MTLIRIRHLTQTAQLTAPQPRMPWEQVKLMMDVTAQTCSSAKYDLDFLVSFSISLSWLFQYYK